MTGRPLRIVEPDDLPTPRVDNDTTIVVTEAVDALAALRSAYWLGDSAVHLHALASLIAQAQLLLPAPSTTPASRTTAGPRSANYSTSHQLPQPADTGNTNNQLDEDHPHNADERVSVLGLRELHDWPREFDAGPRRGHPTVRGW
jgi:hypothetical protein